MAGVNAYVGDLGEVEAEAEIHDAAGNVATDTSTNPAAVAVTEEDGFVDVSFGGPVAPSGGELLMRFVQV